MIRPSTNTLLLALFTAVLLAANAEPIRALFELARTNPTASHVVLVPLVTLALLFQDRTTTFADVRAAWWSGSAIVIAGLLVLAAARTWDIGNVLSLSIGGIVIAWVGGFITAYGWTPARRNAFALLFVVFTIPVPAFILEQATIFLKRGSTEVVAAIFSLTNTPFHREGFTFLMPGFLIQIADECSGIRSSIALILTGLLVARTFLRRSWSRALLLLAILPLSLLKNGIRIAVLTLLAMRVDPGFLEGRLHHEGGIVFFALTLGMLTPVLLILRRLEPPRFGSTLAIQRSRTESIA
jgi:exosortase